MMLAPVAIPVYAPFEILPLPAAIHFVTRLLAVSITATRQSGYPFPSRECYVHFCRRRLSEPSREVDYGMAVSVGPLLAAASYRWIVPINARPWIRSAIHIARAIHDFGEALQAFPFTGWFRTHDVLHSIASRAGDDASATVCLNCGDEYPQF